MKRKMTVVLLLMTMTICSLFPAYADEKAAQVFDTAAVLLTETENVTITGNATFSLDGEAFKFMETTYVQDGANSKWILNLSSPKADGSLRENGFTVIANNRYKYGMEVFQPGFYTVAEDNPQSVILRPSVELSQMISLGHGLLEMIPTWPEDVFSYGGKELHVRLEEGQVPDSVSNLLSLAVLLAIQRTMNIVDDSIAFPPYPEEANCMADYITPTQAIICSTEKYELTELSVDAKLDGENRFTEANGTVGFTVHTFLEGEHDLHITFAGTVSDYGSSTVPAFDAAEYSVEPAEGTFLPAESDTAGYGTGDMEEARVYGNELTYETEELETHDLVYWINPEGGTKYHRDRNCRSIHPRYLPLQVSITKEDLTKEPYTQLGPCHVCGAEE